MSGLGYSFGNQSEKRSSSEPECSTKIKGRSFRRFIVFPVWDLNCMLKKALKPIFHCNMGSRWVTNVTEMSTNNMGTQHNLYSIGSRWGFAFGVTQIVCFALGVTQILAFLDTNMLVNPT